MSIFNFENKEIFNFFTTKSQEFMLHELGLDPNHQFSPKRLGEFARGRYCAIKALEQLGITNAIIPIGENRAPIWPEGIVGSISHCDSLTGAIVAKKSECISLGLDIEEIGKVTPDLWDLVFTENEKLYLFGLSEKEKIVNSTAIFSIKEAFYKFQFPLTNFFLDFLDVEVKLPECNQVNIIHNSYSINLEITTNRSNFFIQNECIVAVIW